MTVINCIGLLVVTIAWLAALRIQYSKYSINSKPLGLILMSSVLIIYFLATLSPSQYNLNNASLKVFLISIAGSAMVYGDLYSNLSGRCDRTLRQLAQGCILSFEVIYAILIVKYGFILCWLAFTWLALCVMILVIHAHTIRMVRRFLAKNIVLSICTLVVFDLPSLDCLDGCAILLTGLTVYEVTIVAGECIYGGAHRIVEPYYENSAKLLIALHDHKDSSLQNMSEYIAQAQDVIELYHSQGLSLFQFAFISAHYDIARTLYIWLRLRSAVGALDISI